jgi:hypothetical protein
VVLRGTMVYLRLLVRRENSWKPVFVIRTVLCNNTYLPTYQHPTVYQWARGMSTDTAEILFGAGCVRDRRWGVYTSSGAQCPELYFRKLPLYSYSIPTHSDREKNLLKSSGFGNGPNIIIWYFFDSDFGNCSLRNKFVTVGFNCRLRNSVHGQIRYTTSVRLHNWDVPSRMTTKNIKYRREGIVTTLDSGPRSANIFPQVVDTMNKSKVRADS